MPEKKQPRPRRTYTPEFKQQLVDLYRSGKRKCDIVCEYDDIQDKDLTNALQSLMTLFVNITRTFSTTITDMIKKQVYNWMTSHARFIQAMFSDLCWES